jgi:hypothetical protein
MWNQWIASLSIGLCFLLVSGCAKTLHFQIIDAEDKQPLEGVVVKYAWGPGDPFRCPVPPGFLTKTGPEGIVGTPPLSNQGVHNFRFEKDGYLCAHMQWSDGDTVAYLRYGHGEAQPKSTVGVITIAMPRAGPGK